MLEAYEEDRDRDITRAVNEKEGDIQTLTDQLNNLRGGFDELMTSHEEALSKTEALEAEIKQLKVKECLLSTGKNSFTIID